MRKNIFGLIAILCALLLWTPFSAVSAEEGFYIRPVLPKDQASSAGYYHLNVKPGQSRTLQAVINNEMNQAITVEINGANGFSNPYGNMAYSAEETTDYSSFLNNAYKMKNLIKIQDTVTVGPNEEKTVDFTVTIPNDMTEGQLLGAIQFTAKVKESDSNDNIDTEAAFAVDIKQRYTIGILLELPNQLRSNVELGHTNISLTTNQPKVLTQIKNLNPVITNGLVLSYKVFEKNGTVSLFEGEDEIPSLAPATTLDFPISWNHSTIEYGNYVIKGTLYDKESGEVTTEFTNEFDITEEKLEKFNDLYGDGNSQTPMVLLSKKWSWLWLLLLLASIYVAYRYGLKKKEEEWKKELASKREQEWMNEQGWNKEQEWLEEQQIKELNKQENNKETNE